MSARLKPTQSEFVEDTLLVKPSVEPAIRLADLKNDATGRSSLGNVDPLGRLGRPLAFARYLITFCIGVALALAWQSYRGATREAASLRAISFDRDAMRQSLDRFAASVATNQEQMTRSMERSINRIAAGQEQTTREISDLQTVEQYILDRLSALQTRLAPTAASNPALRSPQGPMMRSNIP